MDQTRRSQGARVERFLFGDQPSALELLWGHEVYMEKVIAGATLFWAIFLPSTLIAIALPGPEVPHFRAGWATALTLLSGVIVVLAFMFLRKASQYGLYRLLAVCCPLVGAAIWVTGPFATEPVALLPVLAAAFTLVYATRAAISLVGLALASYGVVLLTVDGYTRPATRFVLLLGICAATIAMMHFLVNQIRVLANSEREANARVARMNAELEERVTEQVDEIDRLGRLRRFLSPQVADSVMSAGPEDLLATHRRQIAVIFIDLRGFTAFSAVAEPEDVVEVLTEFYAAVGAIVKRLEATVGTFAGDGVMAYFNDPVQCDDPAGRALEMAISLRVPMSDLGERWKDRGFDISYGVGIAYGYATLGTIGFEERSDYTPIGSVVNLAARLCDEAGKGEILLDGRARQAVRDRVEASEVDLTLKGFGGPVTAHRVSGA